MGRSSKRKKERKLELLNNKVVNWDPEKYGVTITSTTDTLLEFIKLGGSFSPDNFRNNYASKENSNNECSLLVILFVESIEELVEKNENEKE